MASISTDAKGLRRIIFVNADCERKTIYLGKIPKRRAAEIKLRVEALVAAKAGNYSVDRETAEWVAGIGDDLAAKLATLELITERTKSEISTLRDLIRHVESLRSDAKPRTLTNLKQAGAKLTEHFGDNRAIDRITPVDVDGFVAALRKKNHAPAYISRLVKYGKQFFHAARRLGVVKTSPFDEIKAGSMANPERMYFLSRDDTQKILDACPDAEWRLIVALARYGGLRCPSELVAMTWADVDWERGRFLVKSPKTAHHADGGRRWVPLFPELRPYLDEARAVAAEGSTYLVERTRSHDTNLRTAFDRIVYRAGLIPWPKPFQNMRASRETELAQTFPLHVAAAWIGNSARVAAKHYLQVTESDFQRAAEQTQANDARPTRKPTRAGTANDCQEGTIVPSYEQNRRKNAGTPKNADEMRVEGYARQESNL